MVRFSGDGSKILGAGYPSGIVQIWDAAAGKEIQRIDTPPGYRGTADYAYVSSDFTKLYIANQEEHSVVIEKNEQRSVRRGNSGNVLIWDLVTGQNLAPIPRLHPEHGVLVGYLSPGGDKLITVEQPSYDVDQIPKRKTVLHDLKTGTAQLLGEGYAMAAFTQDNKTAALCFFGEADTPSQLKLLDLSNSKELFSAKSKTKKGAKAWPRGFSWPAFSPNGKWLAILDGEGRIDKPATLRVFDVRAGKDSAEFETAGNYPFLHPTFSRKSSLLAAIDYKGGVTMWDFATKKSVLNFRQSELHVWTASFSPDGKTLAVFGQPKGEDEKTPDPDPLDQAQPRIFLFDTANPDKDPEILMCPHGWIGDVAFSPDGKRLAAGSSGAVHIFDVSRRP